MTTMRHLRDFLGVTLTPLLGVMLIATSYFTLFDLEWIVFLAGVLFAAVTATASQASKSQWPVLIRTPQLQYVKGVLADETARLERTTEALRIAELRFHLISDALPAYPPGSKHSAGYFSLIASGVDGAVLRQVRSFEPDFRISLLKLNRHTMSPAQHSGWLMYGRIHNCLFFR